jgi:hypothetical protein
MPWNISAAPVADQADVFWEFMKQLPTDSVCKQECKKMVSRSLGEGRDIKLAAAKTLEWVVDAYPEEWLMTLRGIGILPTDPMFLNVCMETAMRLRLERGKREELEKRVLELEMVLAAPERGANRGSSDGSGGGGRAAFTAFSGDGYKLNNEGGSATEGRQRQPTRLISHAWDR